MSREITDGRGAFLSGFIFMVGKLLMEGNFIVREITDGGIFLSQGNYGY